MRAHTGERWLRAIALVAAAVFAGFSAHAQSVFEPRDFTSPEHEQRYRSLVEELRCLVCQNQNIADSNADLALDLRREVYRMVEDGEGTEEIAEFMVARYGEFVLYRPPVRGETLLLWAGPFLLAVAGLTVLFLHLRQSRKARVAPLDEEARERARRIIAARD